MFRLVLVLPLFLLLLLLALLALLPEAGGTAGGGLGDKKPSENPLGKPS